jgi:cytochrome c2
MKMWVKIMVGILGGLVAIVGGFAAFVAVSDFPSFPVQTVNLKVEVSPARLERGKKLASMLCIECHQNPSTKQLTGRLMFDLPAEFGTVYTKNITQHPIKGIGAWSDGEVAYLLRTGVHPKTGQLVPPYIIKLPNMADEDLYSIIAWLRSQDPMVQALDIDNRPSQPSFLTKVLCRTVFKPFAYPSQSIALPDTTSKVALGKYLVANLGCVSCHSADVTKVNEIEIEKSVGFMGGGSNWLDVNRKTLYSPNITFDTKTGIGLWSEDDFRRAMRDGIRPDGKAILYPMERKLQLTDHELNAMYGYLKTVPIIANQRKPAEEYVLPPNASAGMKVYYKYGCQRCHGENGLGIGDLRQANVKYPTNDILTDVIKHPNKYFPETVMIQWDGIIQKNEYVPLCAYVRELGQRTSAEPKASHSQIKGAYKAFADDRQIVRYILFKFQ